MELALQHPAPFPFISYWVKILLLQSHSMLAAIETITIKIQPRGKKRGKTYDHWGN